MVQADVLTRIGIFLTLVSAGLVSAIATTIGLPTVAVVVIGTACGLLYFVCSIVSGQLRYSRFWSSYTPAHPTES